MQSSRKILSWIILIVATIFGAGITIHDPHESLSQQDHPGNGEQTNNYYAYHPDHSFSFTTSNSGDDEEGDDSGDEDSNGVGDTTEICNRYLETCPEAGATATQGTDGSSCNKLFESCPESPSKLFESSPSPSPSPNPTIASLANTTTVPSLSGASGNLTCPRVIDGSVTASSGVGSSGAESDYKFLRKWTVPFSPAGLALDDVTGSIYVSNYANNSIQKFNSNGTFLSTWGTQGSANGQFNHPYGVAADGSGNVFVSDYDNHRIQKFNSNGTFLTTWGTQGSANGQFNHPYGVAADGSGNVFVSDYDNHRIQKFNS